MVSSFFLFFFFLFQQNFDKMYIHVFFLKFFNFFFALLIGRSIGV